MQERPILFSSEMVRAILSDRKTQTRRVMNPQPPLDATEVFAWFAPDITENKAEEGCYYRCPRGLVFHRKSPYGMAGDHLWVRESIGIHVHPTNGRTGNCVYRADFPDTPDATFEPRWTPSIHMPRWACRIVLEVISVRVERLQDMKFVDWKKDFVPSLAEVNWALASFTGASFQRNHSRTLWDKINADRGYSWDSNPWVWVIEFRRKI